MTVAAVAVVAADAAAVVVVAAGVVVDVVVAAGVVVDVVLFLSEKNVVHFDVSRPCYEKKMKL